MPTLPLTIAPEVFLEHRGYHVFRAYRRDAFPEPYTYVFTLSPDDEEDAWQWQFDVRELPGAGEAPKDIPGLIRQAIDHGLDGGVSLPFAGGAGPLPDPAHTTPAQGEPSDWELLAFLAAVRGRTGPVQTRLEERHVAGAVHLIALLAALEPEARRQLEQWLRRGHPVP